MGTRGRSNLRIVALALFVLAACIRENVAHNMEITPDGQALVLAVVGYGVFRAELPSLSEG